MEDTNTTVPSSEETDLQTSSPTNLKIDPVTWAAAGAVAKWVGEKAAGGLVSAAMGKVFSEVMDAIGMGGPDLVGKLDKISTQLVDVQKSLDRLTEMTAEILKQLAELKDFMEKSLQIGTLVAAITKIDDAYGSSSGQLLSNEGSTGRAISLREFVEKMPHYPGITQQQLKDAAQDFATYVKDVRLQIAIIHTTLAKPEFGQASLLTHWARELAQQLNAKKIGHDAAYLVLEGYFLRAVSMQLKGVSVHCVALGTGDHGPQLIHDYLQDTFAPMMKTETAAFVEAVELMLFLTVKPTMQIGLPDVTGGREFDKTFDEILLRADLISAALNLISYKADAGKPAPTLQSAIQGIYGRALFRPSDLNDGKPPSIAIAGYSAAAPTAVSKANFPCLDLTESNGKAVLRDASDSAVTMAHYYWKFNSPEPAAEKPIDPSQRGGVTPKLYKVFGDDQPPVLAASVFDVSRLYRGLSTGAKQTYRSDKFPGTDHFVAMEEKFTFHRNPLTNEKGDAFETFFTIHHNWMCSTRQNSWVVHPLFSYSGGRVKVRLRAHVASMIDRKARKDGKGGTAFNQHWDVYNRLHLWHSNGSKKTFYISVDSFGNDKPISNLGHMAWVNFYNDYKARRDGFFEIEFELEAGDYELAMGSEAHIAKDVKYDGWQSTSLTFFLHGISIERV